MSRKNVSDDYYKFIISFADSNGRMPTLEEIMSGMSKSSKGVVHHHISNLVGRHLLDRDDNGRISFTEYHFKLVRVDSDEVAE